jgi:hypothetical protein
VQKLEWHHSMLQKTTIPSKYNKIGNCNAKLIKKMKLFMKTSKSHTRSYFTFKALIETPSFSKEDKTAILIENWFANEIPFEERKQQYMGLQQNFDESKPTLYSSHHDT